MNFGQYQFVEKWKDENDLFVLPSAETDQYEYKSSLTPEKDLGEKISVAASAFWNTGGGIFIAGVDGNGKVDSGIASTVGRQSRRDWVDQQIMKTQPPGSYLINQISTGASIKPDKMILVIAFDDSPYVHMAYDNKYYVRLGAHSLSANHYLVEAIRARKSFQSPILRALLQRSRRKSGVVELGIVVVNDSAALDVRINLEPLPIALLENFKDRFPLQIPLIDRSHPFHLELYSWGLRSQIFGEDPVNLIAEYEDTLGKNFRYTQIIDVRYGIDPMQLGDTDLGEIAKALKDINSSLGAIQEGITPSAR